MDGMVEQILLRQAGAIWVGVPGGCSGGGSGIWWRMIVIMVGCFLSDAGVIRGVSGEGTAGDCMRCCRLGELLRWQGWKIVVY